MSTRKALLGIKKKNNKKSYLSKFDDNNDDESTLNQGIIIDVQTIDRLKKRKITSNNGNEFKLSEPPAKKVLSFASELVTTAPEINSVKEGNTHHLANYQTNRSFSFSNELNFQNQSDAHAKLLHSSDANSKSFFESVVQTSANQNEGKKVDSLVDNHTTLASSSVDSVGSNHSSSIPGRPPPSPTIGSNINKNNEILIPFGIAFKDKSITNAVSSLPSGNIHPANPFLNSIQSTTGTFGTTNPNPLPTDDASKEKHQKANLQVNAVQMNPFQFKQDSFSFTSNNPVMNTNNTINNYSNLSSNQNPSISSTAHNNNDNNNNKGVIDQASSTHNNPSNAKQPFQFHLQSDNRSISFVNKTIEAPTHPLNLPNPVQISTHLDPNKTPFTFSSSSIALSNTDIGVQLFSSNFNSIGNRNDLNHQNQNNNSTIDPKDKENGQMKYLNGNNSFPNQSMQPIDKLINSSFTFQSAPSLNPSKPSNPFTFGLNTMASNASSGNNPVFQFGSTTSPGNSFQPLNVGAITNQQFHGMDMNVSNVAANNMFNMGMANSNSNATAARRKALARHKSR